MNQIKAGKLRDVSINKTSNWFTTVGLQLPSVVQTMLDAKKKLAQQGKEVNAFNKNATKISDINSNGENDETRTSRETSTNVSLERFKEPEQNNKAFKKHLQTFKKHLKACEKRVKQLGKRSEHFKSDLRILFNLSTVKNCTQNRGF